MSKKQFKNWRVPKIEEGKLTEWYWFVQHIKNLKLGKNTDIGAFTYINAKNGVVIEDNVQIGSHCSIYSVSTIDNKKGKVILKKNCKIGAHSIIMPGVTIGENAVVGALSLVKTDVPPNEVWAGAPAKLIKHPSNENNTFIQDLLGRRGHQSSSGDYPKRKKLGHRRKSRGI